MIKLQTDPILPNDAAGLAFAVKGLFRRTATTVNGLIDLSARMGNKIINGNHLINQRGAASGSTAYGAGVYITDRWKAGAAGCTMSWAPSGNDIIVTITAGSLMQVVEDKNVEGGVYALQNSGTAQARIAVNGAATAGTYAAATTAAPLLSASATANQSICVEFTTGTVDKVQLESGAIATAFERRHFGVELALCQRYYEVGTYLLQSAAIGFFAQTIPFKVTKRASPTVGATFTYSSAASGGLAVNGIDSFYMQANASASGGYMSGTWTASAEL